MKFLLAVALIVLTACQAEKSRVTEEPLAFKGLQIGATQADVQKRYPQAQCTSADACLLNYKEIVEGKYGYINQTGLRESMTVAAIPVDEIFFGFAAGRLDLILIVFAPTHFQVVAAALRDKYGAPSDGKVVPMITGIGVSVNNQQLHWAHGGGHVSATQFLNNLTESGLLYNSPQSYQRSMSGAGRKMAAKDL